MSFTPVAINARFITDVESTDSEDSSASISSSGYWEFDITYANGEMHTRLHNLAYDIESPVFQKYFASHGVKTIYNVVRVSTKQQADTEKTSPDSQEKVLQSMPDAKNTHNVRIMNIGIVSSAFYDFPKEMKNIISGCVSGDEIRVWRVDRFSRNLELAIHHLQELKKKGVDVVSVSENVSFIKNEDKFVEKLKIANAESENLSARIKQSKKYLRDQGHSYVGGRVAYGKKIVIVNGKRIEVQNADEMFVIRKIIRMRNWAEYSIGRIAEILNFQQMYQRNKIWTSMSVGRIFRMYKNL